jgi:hypothetical protein
MSSEHCSQHESERLDNIPNLTPRLFALICNTTTTVFHIQGYNLNPTEEHAFSIPICS